MERVAGGGTVMFVDHDQARLAGRITERWQLDGSGRVTVAAGSGTRPPVPFDGAVVVIGLTGLEPDSAARLRGIPGVLWSDGSTVRAAAAMSDEVLRQVLSWDGVHVAFVRGERS
jgi:ABC-2 type transport system ATP-binding protein